MTENGTDTLQPITQELVRELRLRGRGDEAQVLLDAHYKDVKKAGKRAYNNERIIVKLIRKSKGICVSDYCKSPANGDHVCCKYHLIQQRRYYHKRKQKI